VAIKQDEISFQKPPRAIAPSARRSIPAFPYASFFHLNMVAIATATRFLAFASRVCEFEGCSPSLPSQFVDRISKTTYDPFIRAVPKRKQSRLCSLYRQ
jgi:hypothetical protein